MSRDLMVRCPCCGAALDVDARTGQVLRHRKPGESRPDPFVAPRSSAEPEDAFRKAREQLETRRRMAEERFGRESERARHEPDARPPHPFDND